MSPDYQAALEAVRAETAKFRAVAEAYRARRIDDAEYLAARKAYYAATAEFDKAWNKETSL